MAVSAAVSEAHVAAELEQARPHLDIQGWELALLDPIRLRASIAAPPLNGNAPELFTYEFTFDNYRELPPIVDALYLEGRIEMERNTARCFPTGGKGYYHGNQRICARWSRNAYGLMSGPHPDWATGDWAAQAPHHNTIGGMLTLLRNLLYRPDGAYTGRAA